MTVGVLVKVDLLQSKRAKFTPVTGQMSTHIQNHISKQYRRNLAQDIIQIKAL